MAQLINLLSPSHFQVVPPSPPEKCIISVSNIVIVLKGGFNFHTYMGHLLPPFGNSASSSVTTYVHHVCQVPCFRGPSSGPHPMSCVGYSLAVTLPSIYLEPLGG